LRTAALALAAALLAAPLLADVDPFYGAQLREGIAAAERGDHAEAAEILRVACFGMLDDEPQLAACLVRLAMAQAGAGDRAGFAQTFARLVEGEELVGLYSKADLPAELRAPFEARVVEWVPRETLRSTAGFASLAAGQDEAQLLAMAPRARRARLRALMEDEPQQPRWPLLLARLERLEGEPRAAQQAAEQALRLDPSSLEARCVRGWARLDLSQLAEGAEDLAGCSSAVPGYTVVELGARVRLSQWGEAEALVARLTEAERREPGVSALVRRVEQGVAREARDPGAAGAAARRPPAESSPAPNVPGESSSERATAESARPAALPAEDEAALARVQAEVGRARSTEQVLAVYDDAAALAERFPNDRRVQHTAAEIAYRASRFGEAVRHFRQGGDPGEEQPLLLFYLAVALWETGARDEAARTMRRCEGRLRPTPFVESYRAKILGREGAPG
jgi:tetratricopeptide (TPR) repeat protein